MNKKPKNRQAINLKSFRAKSIKKPTDPHYTGSTTLSPHLASYIQNCVENNEDPELFISLWVHESNGSAALGIAIPTSYIPPSNRMTLEDFEESSWNE